MVSNIGLLDQSINMPLHCNVCPKQPDFSDVSHLLTHVASKGHLSAYYKMKVKAGTDPSSKLIIDSYDDWYEIWSVQDLMRDRMSQKDRKKGGPHRQATSGHALACNRQARSASITANVKRRSLSSIASVTTPRAFTPLGAEFAGRQSHLRQGVVVDPQLDRHIKIEPGSGASTPALSFALQPQAPPYPYAQSFPAWPDHPYTYSPRPFDAFHGVGSEPSDDDLSQTEDTSKGRRSRRIFSDSTRSRDVDDESDDMINDVSKLKGVYWAGMGMFDSATPEMRRKRNQKKATSVVQQLQATSEIIEPLEMVFDQAHNLRRERLITGVPDEDEEHLEGETTPDESSPPPRKKPRNRKPRQALREKDTNSGRVLRKTHARYTPQPSIDLERKRRRYDGPDDDDDDLTYGRSRAKRRTGISVHRDNSGPDITFGQSIVHHKIPIDTLNSAFRAPFLQQQSFPNHGQPIYSNGHTRAGVHHARHPSHSFPSGNFRAMGNMSAMDQASFGSFGQINGFHSLLQAPSFANGHFGMSSSQPVFNTFTPQMAMNGFPQCFSQTDSMFGGSENVEDQIPHIAGAGHEGWDVFSGMTGQDMTVPTTAENNLQPVTDASRHVNPFYFNETQEVRQQDDEATVSAPATPEDEPKA